MKNPECNREQPLKMVESRYASLSQCFPPRAECKRGQLVWFCYVSKLLLDKMLKMNKYPYRHYNPSKQRQAVMEDLK